MIIINNDPTYTIDLALDDYVSDTDQISTYEIDKDTVQLVNGEIHCSARFDDDSTWYTVVLHRDGFIRIYN